MAGFDSGLLLRSARDARPALVAVALLPPVSLMVLYLWMTNPHESAHGSHAAATTLARAVAFLGAWVLMTAAMMLPSAMPLLVSLDRVARHQATPHVIPLVAAGAYVGVWSGVGVAIWVVSLVADAYLLPRTSPGTVSVLAGAGLVLAGAYGLSPLASACLRACRRPFGFLARHWRGGDGLRMQAARIGAAYGVSCVGCCVPMIGLMFVVGMANIAIVVGMTVLMVFMKTSASGVRIAKLLSIGLILTGVSVGLAWLPLVPSHH